MSLNLFQDISGEISIGIMELRNKMKHKTSHSSNLDKISDLPDAIIHHILSLIPIKCAMSTCVLSKRWKYISNSIPTLDFRNWRTEKSINKNQKLLETKSFENFLDTVLFLHEKPYIQNLYFDWDEFLDESRVNRWISTIIKRNVQEFGLFKRFLSSSFTTLPLSFFTWESLTLLDLDFGMTTGAILMIPKEVYFPKLKILRLTALSFPYETSSRKLFSNCLILEELRLFGCRVSEGLCIVNTALKNLSIVSCSLSKSTTLNISAPNLLTISYSGALPADFVLDSFLSLIEANVDIRTYYGRGYQNKIFVKLFKKLSRAKLLNICANSFLVLNKEDILFTELPLFKNLIHLGISSEDDPWSCGSVKLFFRFLQLSPNLESIVFGQNIDIHEEESDDCWGLDPKSLLPHLKSIKFKNFQGRPVELNAIKLFLKYAGFLEIVTIVAHSWLSKDYEERSLEVMVLENMENHHNFTNGNMGLIEDKISDLPDELIHHILSFLPTKCVLSTCILSKRWKHLSNSITSFDFREWQRASNRTVEEYRLETERFMDFLETVLFRHDKSNIKKFYLGRGLNFDESRLTKWIDMVIKRKVEELIFSEVYETTFILPLSCFTCDSLTVLELDCVSFNVPENVSLSRLKLLRLRRMRLTCGIEMEKLFSKCPILEELSLIHCNSWESQVLCISNLALRNLHINCCKFRESTMKICAPNLSTISYTEEVPGDFVVDSFPSLVEAVIDVHSNVKYPAKKNILIKLFEKLSNVKLLKISGGSFLVLSEAEILLTDLPAFNNLIHLEISSKFECTSSGFLRIFYKLLELSPNLESIVFAKSINCTCEEDDCWSFDPNCSLLHLREIKFNYLNGNPRELDAIKLFLKYAGVLETMTIVASPELSRNYEAQTKAMMQLLMFPRPINCVVKFLLDF